MTAKTLFAQQAWLPDGWARRVAVRIDAGGTIREVCRNSAVPDGAELVDLLVPGVPNVHSHAFQRVLAGLVEQAGSMQPVEAGRDSFWTWRERMYACVDRLSIADLSAIATNVYVEMLKAGYTSVGEFHYFHRPNDGEPAASSRALIRAAEATGISLTLLPTLYLFGGFGGQPAGVAQQRFATSVDEYLELLESLRGMASSNLRIGAALHSLRAVSPDTLARVLEQHARIDPDGPVHVHAAEQVREVDDCLRWSGERPVEWLLNHGGVDRRWCVIHATHMKVDEIHRLASSGAVVGLCPTTEANLGDGLFALMDYLDVGGRIAIGSDSHVCIDPWEELRWLEYGQRLSLQQRNVAATVEEPHTGARLLSAVLEGGARALAQPVGRIAEQYRANLLVIDVKSPLLTGCVDNELIDSLVFAAGRQSVTDVMVGGEWVVRDRHHSLEEEAEEAFAEVRRRLSSGKNRAKAASSLM